MIRSLSKSDEGLETSEEALSRILEIIGLGDCVSKNSFGHSGFTGTYAWADPEGQIIYVFLSNRTYPTMENRKLIDYNIRTDIKKIVFD